MKTKTIIISIILIIALVVVSNQFNLFNEPQSIITDNPSVTVITDVLQPSVGDDTFLSSVALSVNRDNLYGNMIVATKFNGEWVALNEINAYRSTEKESTTIDISDLEEGVYDLEYYYIYDAKNDNDVESLNYYWFLESKTEWISSRIYISNHKVNNYKFMIANYNPSRNVYTKGFNVKTDLDANIGFVNTKSTANNKLYLSYRQLLDRKVNMLSWNKVSDKVYVSDSINSNNQEESVSNDEDETIISHDEQSNMSFLDKIVDWFMQVFA